MCLIAKNTDKCDKVTLLVYLLIYDPYTLQQCIGKLDRIGTGKTVFMQHQDQKPFLLSSINSVMGQNNNSNIRWPKLYWCILILKHLMD